MKIREVRQITVTEMESRLREMEEEHFRLSFRHSTQRIENPLRLRTLRRDIARLRTVLLEDRRGMRKLPR